MEKKYYIVGIEPTPFKHEVLRQEFAEIQRYFGGTRTDTETEANITLNKATPLEQILGHIKRYYDVARPYVIYRW